MDDRLLKDLTLGMAEVVSMVAHQAADRGVTDSDFITTLPFAIGKLLSSYAKAAGSRVNGGAREEFARQLAGALVGGADHLNLSAEDVRVRMNATLDRYAKFKRSIVS